MYQMMAQIVLFGGEFAPRGYAFCDGQLLPISSHTALFSLLGTTYGGDGRTSFGLPDLRSRVPVHKGAGPGLLTIALGQKSGSTTKILTAANLPAHNHKAAINVSSADGEDESPVGGFLGKSSTELYQSSADGQMNAGSVTIGNTGSSAPVNNMPPFQGLNYIISLEGDYPSRS